MLWLGSRVHLIWGVIITLTVCFSHDLLEIIQQHMQILILFQHDLSAPTHLRAHIGEFKTQLQIVI